MTDQFSDLAAASTLDEPTRRAIFEFVRRANAPVGRDEVSSELGLPRPTAAFHLDKLAAEGLVDVEFARRGDRTGPGAGRPAKFYRRASRSVAVLIPQTSYDLAAQLLAQAVDESAETGSSTRELLFRNARDFGRQVGEQAVEEGDRMLACLERCGYEPRAEGSDIALVNCPFHKLAQQHTALVCGMNLELISGLIEGTRENQTARLEPAPGYCCVRITDGTTA